MRTRSQQASPGGFVSLDENAPRRTRSAKNAAQQEPATSEQPPTRSKSQRAPKKTTTTTTTKKSTAKAQTRKATTTKRTTRQSTRKTDQPVSNEDAQTTHTEEDFATDNTTAEKNTPREVPETVDPTPASSENENPDRESLPHVSHPFMVPQPPKESQEIDCFDGPDPRGIGAASCLKSLIDELSSVGSPLSERSKTPSWTSEDGTEAALAPRPAQESGATNVETSTTTERVSLPTPAAEERTVEPPAEPTVAEPRGVAIVTSSEQFNTVSSASAAGSGGVVVVEDERVGALIASFARLSLDDLAPRSSNEAAATLMESTTASFGEPVEPAHVTRRSLRASRQEWILGWAQQVPSTGYFHPITGQLVEGPAASVELVGDPASNRGPPTRRIGVRDYILRRRRREVQVMSPLQEEPQSSPGPGSRAVALNAVPPRGIRAQRAQNTKRLTKPPVTRKRARTESSDEEAPGPQTPAANKRRNLGPPGSTPYRPATRPRSLTANITPYSERLRRRAAEKDGRIHSTSLRVSQLLAQQEADRRRQAAESSAPPCSELPRTTFDFSLDDAHETSQGQEQSQSLQEQSSTPQPPATPERQSGWNIRGLLNSVPRTFTRILPSFRRTPEPTQVQAPPEPSSERISRTQPPQSSSISQSQAQNSRRSSEEPPQKRRRKSWSLFAQPFDRSLYLGDIPKKDSATSSSAPLESRPVAKLSAEATTPQESATSDAKKDVAAEGEDSRGRETEEQKQKKRKRSPSPDVIPNPPGCSYGLDLDYFCYSSESEDEQEPPLPRTEPNKFGRLTRTAVRGALRSERHSSKKVRFDASPEDTPSKLRLRARATDPYRGRHFIGMGNDSEIATPDSPTPAPHAADESSSRRPGFVPNVQGTFQLDYDAFSDDSDSSGASASANVSASAPIPAPSSATVTQASISESVPSTESRQTPRQAAPAPSTPAKIDEEALARARSQAEKYKPKTPSGLRTASRYSSPMTATPDTVSAPVIAPAITPTPSTSQTAPASAPEPEQQTTEDFGDDEFAREAQWLYENCPSGDLNDLVWPQPITYEEEGFSPEVIDLVNEIWDPSTVDYAYTNIWTPGLDAFKRELETGASEAAQA
ncbi:hypothetical protein CBS63078_6955 [Aspergillus niger]|nr:hypothetical protein CBS11350_3310 [Aspergillus niger]KAI2894924.1 hypothetical protein CBS13152_4006 [Aspergillus niger]KAI2900668.1 hypothetical protein CBS63078_6955 [Aspergillus niger]KAI2974647.1 hypothetical protein CBS147323_1307 [Aspergillus niger]KAI2997077.1 hypothetical protein CBS147345_9502 [Aspergillus niger]